MTFLLLSLAGGLGAVMRFVTDSVVARHVRLPVPVGCLTVNVLGSFVLGLVAGLTQTGAVSHPTALVVGTGFCGGFTTFSTASVETVGLALSGRPGHAMVHAVAILAGSLLAAAFGLVTALTLTMAP